VIKIDHKFTTTRVKINYMVWQTSRSKKPTTNQ